MGAQNKTISNMKLSVNPAPLNQSYKCTVEQTLMANTDMNVTLTDTQWQVFNVPEKDFDKGKMFFCRNTANIMSGLCIQVECTIDQWVERTNLEPPILLVLIAPDIIIIVSILPGALKSSKTGGSKFVLRHLEMPCKAQL